MNISGTLNIFRLLREPTLCLPQHTVSTLNQLPIPLSKAFSRKDGASGAKDVDIQAVVLDKDNCFAVPHTNEIHKPLQDHFERLRTAYPGSKLLIVSNTAGTDSDKNQKEAALLEANTGVKVLRHSTKKPGCKEEVMAYFKAHPDSGVTRPDQIAIVGDRLSTDIMMANMMGSYGVWVRDGVTGRGFFASMEDRLQNFLFRRGYEAPDPAAPNQFE
ncbi:HAD-superfamily phosphatase [Plenodomus tracheiphilus IPT5]|uniref:HAD-superfamily phosphatase n=1 Tax=Plenodomus tracheiphilus IPT5 TaxID=1408161 RepID=A0A6A7BAQ5_9PLEO|nr:HAD-superfamily phosphatase [Plenodomus tracheiphilus IPT5]